MTEALLRMPDFGTHTAWQWIQRAMFISVLYHIFPLLKIIKKDIPYPELFSIFHFFAFLLSSSPLSIFTALGGAACVKKVRIADNVISTYAGTCFTQATSVNSEDYGAATNAFLNRPMGLAVDPFDNLYIADHAANQVRMVDSSGAIRTIAGLGTGFRTSNSPCSGDYGYAQVAELRPLALAFSTSGDFPTLFIAGILFFNTVLNSPLNTSLNTPPPPPPLPSHLFIADGFNSNVRGVKIFAMTPTPPPTVLPADPGGSSGTIYTIAGLLQGPYNYGAPAQQISLNTEFGIALDPTSTFLYVYSTDLCTVRRISLMTYMVERVVGAIEQCPGSITQTPTPRAVAGQWTYALSVNINQGSSLAFDSNGMLYIASRFSHLVYVYNPGTTLLMLLVGPSALPAGTPWATGNNYGDGSLSYGGTAGQTRLSTPRQMAFDDTNNALYICDSGNFVIRKVTLPAGSVPLPNNPNVRFIVPYYYIVFISTLFILP